MILYWVTGGQCKMILYLVTVTILGQVGRERAVWDDTIFSNCYYFCHYTLHVYIPCPEETSSLVIGSN